LGALARGGAAPHNPGGNLEKLSRPQAVHIGPAGTALCGLPCWSGELLGLLPSPVPTPGVLRCPHPAGGCCVRAGPGAGRGRSGLGLGCRRAQLVSCGRCGVTAPARWRRRGTTAAPCPSRWRAAAGRRRRVRRPGEAGRCRPVAVSERRPTRPAQWSRSSRPRLGPAPDSGARPRSPAAVGAADRPQRRPGPR